MLTCIKYALMHKSRNSIGKFRREFVLIGLLTKCLIDFSSEQLCVSMERLHPLGQKHPHEGRERLKVLRAVSRLRTAGFCGIVIVRSSPDKSYKVNVRTKSARRNGTKTDRKEVRLSKGYLE